MSAEHINASNRDLFVEGNKCYRIQTKEPALVSLYEKINTSRRQQEIKLGTSAVAFTDLDNTKLTNLQEAAQDTTVSPLEVFNALDTPNAID